MKAIKAPKDSALDDEFAKRLGVESLDKLKELLKGNLENQYAGASKFKLKRALLDALDTGHSFDLPPKMVEADKEAGRLPPEDAKKSEKKLKDEYRKIAERRVRLGLVLAEIGRANNVGISDQEAMRGLQQQAMELARQYGMQPQQVLEMLRQDPNAMAQVRAPLYEDKVCELIYGQAEITEEPISKEELLKDEDEG